MLDDYVNRVDITIKKETHNIEYVIITPSALIILLMFRILNVYLPQEYIWAVFGVSIYTPLTWAIFDIYSLFKSGGRYVYKVEVETYNIILEGLFGLVAYIVTQFTTYILGYVQPSQLFSLSSLAYFLIAYTGITIARYLDRELIRIGGKDNITLAFLFSLTYLLLFSYLFFKYTGA